MARAAATGGNHTGLYGRGYGGPEGRLAVLLAGEAVSIYAGRLSKGARDGLGVRVTALTYVRVYADGIVELLDDGARLFCEQHGL